MKFTYVLKEKLNEVPKVPGVYSFWNKKELLYIGKAGNLQTRIKTHFMQPSYRDNLFMDQVNKIGYKDTSSEIEALLLESSLIKEMDPKYNVLWKDGKGYFFVCITPSTSLLSTRVEALESRAGNKELPRVFLTHQPNSVSSTEKEKIQDTKYKIQDTTYIGPFVDGNALKRTLRSLRKVFPYYTKKHGARLCQYCNLGLCPGPTPDAAKYKKDVKNLAAVLQGKRTSVLKKLKNEMQKTSKLQHYEQAKKLRDQIKDLEVIFSHAHVFRPAEEKIPIDWPFVEAYLQTIFETKKRISRVEAYDISNTQGQESTSSMPVFINGIPAKQHYRKFKIHITGKPNDFAMIQETLMRRLKHEEWGYPDVIIIDGGKGQLSSALRALRNFQIPISNFQTNSKFKIQNSKLKPIAVAAIAKKHNELFIPGQSKPLLLSNMPQPVSNLILHIRDEAHRFAITFHRQLRAKKLLN